MVRVVHWIFSFICLSFISCSVSKHLQQSIQLDFGNFYSDSVSYLPNLRILEKADISGDSLMISTQPGWEKWKLKLFDEISSSKAAIKGGRNEILILHKYKDSTHFFKFDCNADHDFSNEEVYQLAQGNGFITIRNVQFEFGGKDMIGSIYVKPLKTRPLAGVKRKPSAENDDFDIAMLPLVRKAEFKISRGKTFKAALSNNLENSFTKKNASIIIVPAQNTFPDYRSFPVKYHIGDTVYLDKHVYRFTDLDSTGRSIGLAYISTLKRNYGVSAGDYILNIRATNFYNGRAVNIGPSSEFTLLDFWGTWCTPCIELTDSLKRIGATYDKSKLELVSIAFDKSVAVARNYTVSKSMDWPQIFDDMNNSLICSKLKIDVFPTFILLDNSGKIVYRGGGKAALENIEKILRERL